MLTVAFVGSDEEIMTKFVDFICDSLVGWTPFIDNEVTVSNPKPFGDENKYMVQITMGTEKAGEDSHMIMNYDQAFFDTTTSKELLSELRKFWTK